MKQAINILLKLDRKTNSIRKRFDPYSVKFYPHITLVYPFVFKNHKILINHIKNSILGIKSFRVSLKDIEESYPFIQLKVKKGKRELLKLIKKLNLGIFKKIVKKKPLKYSPHMTIGVIKEKNNFKKGIRELKKLKPEFKTTINSIQLITLNKDKTIKSKRSFILK